MDGQPSQADAQALFSSIITLVQNGNSGDLEKLLSANSAPFVQSVINNGLAQEWFKYGPQGESALHIACRRNDLECARILISHGASVNVVNSVKRTPLDVCSPQIAQSLRSIADGSSSSSSKSGITEGMAGLSIGSDQQAAGSSAMGTSPPANSPFGTPAEAAFDTPLGQLPPMPLGQPPKPNVVPPMPMAPLTEPTGANVAAAPVPVPASSSSPAASSPAASSPSGRPATGHTSPARTTSPSAVDPAIVSKNVKDKSDILRGMKDYGVSLFYDGSEPETTEASPEAGKGHSRFRDVPKSLQDVMTVLETRLKADMVSNQEVLTAIEKYDSSPVHPEELTNLVSLINSGNKMLDAYEGVSTQTVVDAIITYFEMLPGPIVPVKYYSTLLYVANVQSSRALMAQSRILFNYLPTISRVLLSRMGFFFLKIAMIDGDVSTPAIDNLSKRFFKYFFRGTNTIAEDFLPTASHHAFLLEELFCNAFMRNLPYVTMQVDQPELAKIRHPDDKQLTIGDIVLFAVTLYDFQNTTAGKNTLSFSKNERVRLVNLHRNDWLEGMLNKKRGFLPKAYVKLILHNNPPARLKTVPGMPILLNVGAQSATAASGVKPSAAATVGPINPMLPQQAQQPSNLRAFNVNQNPMVKNGQFPTQPAPATNGVVTNPAMMMAMNPLAVQQQRGMMFNQGMMGNPNMMANPGMMTNPNMMGGSNMMNMNMMMMMNGTPMSMMQTPQMTGTPAAGAATGGAADAEYQRRMEQLRLAEEQLVQQQMQINMQMQMQQMQQAKLQRKAQELAKAKVDSLKKDNENWQINYDELELEQKIGEGGFGEVYRAKWRGTTVAVKTLKHKGPSSHFSAEEVERYKREVSILRALNHPNLVLFLGASLEPVLCMISEFMFGGSLYDLLYKKKKIPDHTKRCVLALDIAKAMAFLHNHKPPIVHRDLKSLNILLDEKGEHAKVGDVGLAVGIGKGELKGAVGTYSWMPPEMMKGQAYTEKADVYSYGLVLYEMVTGKLPFAGMQAQQISLRVAVYNERPPLPSSVNSKWKDLITACWAADDTKRPSFISILDMLAAIEKR